MGSYDDWPNRRKRASCKECGGLGKVLVVVKVKVRNRRGDHDTISERQRERCRRCKGSGMELT